MVRGLWKIRPLPKSWSIKRNSENVAFILRTATVASALAAFDKFLHRGKRLDAILLTNSGLKTESLLGIVTIHDIPKLNKAVNV